MERKMFCKLDQIKAFLKLALEIKVPTVMGPLKIGHKVGIVHEMEEEDVTWLRTALDSKLFEGLVRKIKLINISDIRRRDLGRLVDKYTICIYIASGHKWKYGHSPSEREELLTILGQNNLIVVIADVEDSSDEEKTRILQSEPKIRRYLENLFLFSRLEKKFDYQRPLRGGSTLRSKKSFRENTSQQQHKSPADPMIPTHHHRQSQTIGHSGPTDRYPLSQDKFPTNYMTHGHRPRHPRSVLYFATTESASSQQNEPPADPPQLKASYTGYTDNTGPQLSVSQLDDRAASTSKREKQEVKAVRTDLQAGVPTQTLRIAGIFSRSANTDYAWLEAELRSTSFHDHIQDVRSFYISNKGYAEFYKEVGRCTFGILYHTKNRGAVNITNVTNSLYDTELEYMSTVLGRNNVIVVIDDLQDSSVSERERILDTQPSIIKYTSNLLLVTEKEKKEKKYLLEKLRDVLMSTGFTEGSLDNHRRWHYYGKEVVHEPHDKWYRNSAIEEICCKLDKCTDETESDQIPIYLTLE